MEDRRGSKKRDPETVRRAAKLQAQELPFAAIGSRLGMSADGVRSMLMAAGHYQPRAQTGRPPKKEK